MLAAVSATLNAQNTNDTTAERVYGVQIGLLGAWAYGEFPLKDEIVLRGEVGLDAGIRGGSFYRKTVFVLAPSLRLEPRWYYNLSERAARGRRTEGNAANFVSLPLLIHPGLFRITNDETIRVDRGIQLLPTWGIRRNLGSRLDYELGIGLGYGVRWSGGRDVAEGGSTGWLHLRIGI